MFRLITMEIKRLRFSKAFWITILGYLIAVGLNLGEMRVKGGITLPIVIGTITNSYFILIFFLAIFISAYIQLDFQCGQIKNIVTSTKDRASFISIKFATLCVLCLLMLAVSVLILSIYAAFFTEDGMKTGNILEALLSFIEMYLMFTFLHAFFMLIAIIMKKELTSILLCVLLGIGLPIVEQLLYIKTNIDFGKISVLNQLMGFSETTSFLIRLLYIGLAVLYCGIAIFIAKKIMRKKDIHI
ncbi:MAG: ABC transporter permease [Lachnospiraceae bacterium]|nr:ABC transporter permease [Lachnospiraceae bacterium]